MKSAAPPPAPDGVPKHRACDECRSRKLACSKEADGCARCRKEGIQCHYSPQKPMGRPRKRRHVEEEAQPAVTEELVHDDLTTTPLGAMNPSHPSIFMGGFQMQSSIPADQNLNFLDESNPSNMEFWDVLPGNYFDVPTDPNLFLSADMAPDGTNVVPPMNLSGVDLLGNINFDEPDHAHGVSRDLSDSLQRYMAEQVSLPRATSSSTPANSSLDSDHGTSVGSPTGSVSTPPPPPPPPSMRAVHTVSCSCLSTLFLALDSLSHLPQEVIPAMRVARNASKVAHDVIKCSTCSIPLIDEPSAPTPIQSFQNLMLLGTLVPSACNAYATILEMVDAETALAKKQGRFFWFTFKDIGGLWGSVGETSDHCSAIHSYNNSSMAPDMWRMTIRAILRLDVYGMGKVDFGIPHATYTQLGLKDVVTLLEDRTRKRHELLDELIATGNTPKSVTTGVIYPNKPCTPEERNCTRILETARVALDNLVIA
ncbi:hypothetical protein EDB81DRAFT_909831 [Dactylonectria macrodidyma]|uniref:Zn(2)-C6 fungal-type domain-containing protein n=1 Tax=Dactylonectria macrodidyma TaxID=307937 RepID=A0A9P9FRB0_9HYPO|nr:hypothetical protein EDB81DRAFT_909831 [Dactylonectria macrodidyma]